MATKRNSSNKEWNVINYIILAKVIHREVSLMEHSMDLNSKEMTSAVVKSH